MKNCLSTNEINRDFHFKVGITEHFVHFNNKKVKFYIYRPMTMASKKEIVIHMPGRNGNAKEYMEQTTFMNSFNTKLSICIEMSEFSAFEFEFGNVFSESEYEKESQCLKENAQFNNSSTWTFNIIFQVLEYIKEKLKKQDIEYILNGIDAAGLFVSYFNFFYPLIENKQKQLPIKSIVGVTSFYFFPFSKARMRLDYIKDIDTSKTATKSYKELIDYNCIKKNVLDCKNSKLISSLNNNNVMQVYYEYINNFVKYFKNPVNRKVQNVNNKNVYHLNENLDSQTFPIGTDNVPLEESKIKELADLHASRVILYQFYEKDTNIYGGVDPEGKNIPNLVSSCNAQETGPFRLFRGMNAWFSTKIDAKEFNWDYVVIPNCGHSSNFANNTIIMANVVDPEYWTNPRFCPEFFYFLKPSLFEE